MDDSLYGDGQSSEPKDTSSVDEQNQESATDLMSKDSFPGGCRVGDKYEIEITGDHGDQFSVKVIGDDEKSESKPDSEGSDDPEMAEINSKY